MSDNSPRITLIHALPMAIQPIQDAFRLLWPEAACNNLLDDSLSSDREREGGLTGRMSARIATLASYAAANGADGILFTCSAFGPAIELAAASLPIPVLKPNEAMFEAALAAGGCIGMLATFAPAIPEMEDEFHRLAAARGQAGVVIRTVCVPEAMAALRTGDPGQHDALLAAAAPSLAACDAVLLAQFSMANAEDAVASALGRPVLTSPAAAVRKLRRAVEARQ